MSFVPSVRIATCVATVLLAGIAQAAILAPGGLVGLSGTTVATVPALAGTVQDDPLLPFAIGFGGGIGLSGNLQDRVALSDDLGTLIFAPRIRDTVGTAGVAPLEILSISLTGYAGYSTDVEYRTDGLGDAGPDTVSRSVDGDTLNFRYTDSPLLPPDESLFLSILTDATQFAPVGSALIVARDGPNGNPFSTTIQGINVPVPEPTSAVLLAGMLSTVLCRRRRGSFARFV